MVVSDCLGHCRRGQQRGKSHRRQDRFHVQPRNISWLATLANLPRTYRGSDEWPCMILLELCRNGEMIVPDRRDDLPHRETLLAGCFEALEGMGGDGAERWP